MTTYLTCNYMATTTFLQDSIYIYKANSQSTPKPSKHTHPSYRLTCVNDSGSLRWTGMAILVTSLPIMFLRML